MMHRFLTDPKTAALLALAGVALWAVALWTEMDGGAL